MSTFLPKADEITRNWYVIDAAGKPLGRVASEAAALLRGKHKPIFTPNVDCGDFVIIINTDKAVLTGDKLNKKLYQHHTGYIGNLKEVKYGTLMAEKSDFVKAALDGKTGVFSTLRRISDLPYTVDYYTEQVSVVANNEKLVPRSWINEQGNDVTNKMIEYLSPLVKGVPQVPYRNGLPDYIGLSHLDVKKQKYSD